MKSVASLLILLAMWALTRTATFAENPRLFIDDHSIAEMKGLKRVLHQPEDIETNPVIVPEHPWEHRRIPFGSVLWFPKEKKFKCWYLAMNIYDSRPGFRGYRKEFHVPITEAAFICYAESDDGVVWKKPVLGLHEFRGSKQNNIVLVSPGTHFDSTSVIHVPHDKEWPYRMITFIGRWPYKEELVKEKWGDPPPFGIKRHGHYGFGSKDGIHWQELNNNEPVLDAKYSDRSMFWWDPKKRIFAGAVKFFLDGKRAQAYGWSRDMIDWTITPDHMHTADDRDHPDDEAEAAYGFPYGSQWIGFAEMRRIRKGGDVKINWELLTSRDGRKWSRPFREVFFSDGPEESWRYQVFKIFANPPIKRDGKLLIYYGGKTGTVPVDKGYDPFQALCLATLRNDGFVSLRAGAEEGWLVSRHEVIKSPAVTINAEVGSNGSIVAEILDQDNNVLKGFSRNDCIPFSGDDVAHTLRWRTKLFAPGQLNSDMKIRFYLISADLFSYAPR